MVHFTSIYGTTIVQQIELVSFEIAILNDRFGVCFFMLFCTCQVTYVKLLNDAKGRLVLVRVAEEGKKRPRGAAAITTHVHRVSADSERQAYAMSVASIRRK